jgi:uncharacterized protein
VVHSPIKNNVTDRNSVTFKNGSTDLAGHVHLPAGFDARTTYPAIVCVHPGSSVKEQTAGLYAARMAEKGYVALAFDASHHGESGGEPRHREDPAARVEDIRCAVDFLTTLDHVDDERLGVLGVCAGGGYAVNAAMTDHRITAVGAVSAINIGRAHRQGAGSAVSPIEVLEAVGRQRTAEARGGAPLITSWTPGSPDAAAEAGITDTDLLEAVDYYRTTRGQHERADNRLLFTSVASVFAFDAFHLVEELLTQPLQIVVGNRVGSFGSSEDGHELFRRASGPKDLFVVDGASHYDLYDRPAYVDQAVAKLGAFFEAHLSG